MAASPDTDVVREAMRQAELGEPGALDRIARAPAGEVARFALAAARWFFGRTEGEAPSADQIRAATAADEGQRDLALAAAVLLGRASAVALDAAALDHALALLDEIDGAAAPPEIALPAAGLKVAAAALRGDPCEPEAQALAADMSAAKLAYPLVELTSFRALAALERQDLASAIDLARRASRMAATEGTPEATFVASTVLARARRHAGRPHLAARIVEALAPHAPPPWRGWIEWERLLAAGEVAASRAHHATTPASGLAGRAAGHLAALLAHARLGERQPYRRCAEALRRETGGSAPLAREAAALLAAVTDDGEPGPLVAPWCAGETPHLPLGLDGVCAGEADDDPRREKTAAYVAAGPGAPGRRILRVGLPLLGERARPDPSGGDEDGEPRSFHRTDSALAALALADGGSMALPDLFQAVYGFTYAPLVHGGVAAVLAHRMRRRAEPFAHVERAGDRLTLEARRAFVIADPRCAQPTTERVLRLIVRRGGLRAREIAGTLRIALRTAQEALQQLVAEGVCQVERAGREIRYRVEDTTFTEPTSLRRWTRPDGS